MHTQTSLSPSLFSSPPPEFPTFFSKGTCVNSNSPLPQSIQTFVFVLCDKKRMRGKEMVDLSLLRKFLFYREPKAPIFETEKRYKHFISRFSGK